MMLSICCYQELGGLAEEQLMSGARVGGWSLQVFACYVMPGSIQVFTQQEQLALRFLWVVLVSSNYVPMCMYKDVL